MKKNNQKSYIRRRLRLFWRRNYALPIALLLVFGLYFYMLKIEPNQLRITQWTFSAASVPPELDNFRIAFAADIHLNNRQLKHLPAITGTLNALQADLILLGGDYVNGNGRGPGIKELMPFLEKLSAPCGVFAIPGNHEYKRGIKEIKHAFADSHIQLLLDNNVKISAPGGGKFNLVGLDYHNNPHILLIILARENRVFYQKLLLLYKF